MDVDVVNQKPHQNLQHHLANKWLKIKRADGPFFIDLYLVLHHLFYS